MTRFTMLRGSSAALFDVGAPAAKLLMLPSTQPACVWPVFLLNKPLYPSSSALSSSLPSSSLPSPPGDVCWFVHVVSLTLSPPLRGTQPKSGDWRWSRCDWRRSEIDAVGAQVSALTYSSLLSTDLFVKWRPAGLTGQLFAAAVRIPRDPIWSVYFGPPTVRHFSHFLPVRRGSCEALRETSFWK